MVLTIIVSRRIVNILQAGPRKINLQNHYSLTLSQWSDEWHIYIPWWCVWALRTDWRSSWHQEQAAIHQEIQNEPAKQPSFRLEFHNVDLPRNKINISCRRETARHYILFRTVLFYCIVKWLPKADLNFMVIQLQVIGIGAVRNLTFLSESKIYMYNRLVVSFFYFACLS